MANDNKTPETTNEPLFEDEDDTFDINDCQCEGCRGVQTDD